jgi:hypothetical protein
MTKSQRPETRYGEGTVMVGPVAFNTRWSHHYLAESSAGASRRLNNRWEIVIEARDLGKLPALEVGEETSLRIEDQQPECAYYDGVRPDDDEVILVFREAPE